MITSSQKEQILSITAQVLWSPDKCLSSQTMGEVWLFCSPKAVKHSPPILAARCWTNIYRWSIIGWLCEFWDLISGSIELYAPFPSAVSTSPLSFLQRSSYPASLTLSETLTRQAVPHPLPSLTLSTSRGQCSTFTAGHSVAHGQGWARSLESQLWTTHWIFTLSPKRN